MVGYVERDQLQMILSDPVKLPQAITAKFKLLGTGEKRKEYHVVLGS